MGQLAEGVRTHYVPITDIRTGHILFTLEELSLQPGEARSLLYSSIQLSQKDWHQDEVAAARLRRYFDYNPATVAEALSHELNRSEVYELATHALQSLDTTTVSVRQTDRSGNTSRHTFQFSTDSEREAYLLAARYDLLSNLQVASAKSTPLSATMLIPQALMALGISACPSERYIERLINRGLRMKEHSTEIPQIVTESVFVNTGE